MRTTVVAAGVLLVAGSAVAQPTNISPTNKYSWSENCGFMNWADANGGAHGVRIRTTHMSGFVWMENAGWLNMGDGSPGGCGFYTNTTGADHGVNIAANGDLYGLAWGENIGWVNFDTRSSLTPHGQQARIDWAAKRLRGYAWGENIGWINLDHGSIFVGTTFCRADWNGDGLVNSGDITAFLTDWLTGVGGSNCTADFNADGMVNSGDITSFLTAWLNAVAGTC